ncbi:MAG: hypothetical protein ACR2NN_18155 [Bryobacteraceae bacterium]
MNLVRVLALTLLNGALVVGAPRKDVFDLDVSRVRIPKDQRGTLHIDSQGVAFQSQDGKTRIRISLRELREADVADPRALRFQTYEVSKWKPTERREYTFRAQPDAPVEDLARFLTESVHRPVVGHYAQGSEFKVAAYHRRTLNGTSGILEIGESSIQFVSDKPSDSRTWLYRDIETIGRPDSFRFRVTTNRETYVLELKEDLPEAAYEFAWSKIYDVGGKSE